MGVCFVRNKNSQIGDKSEKSQEKNSYIFAKDDDDTEFKLSTIFNFIIKESKEIKPINKDMYDAIFSCESIKELFNKGWK